MTLLRSAAFNLWFFGATFVLGVVGIFFMMFPALWSTIRAALRIAMSASPPGGSRRRRKEDSARRGPKGASAASEVATERDTTFRLSVRKRKKS